MSYIDKGWNGAINKRIYFSPSNMLHHDAFTLQNISYPHHNLHAFQILIINYFYTRNSYRNYSNTLGILENYLSLELLNHR